MKFINRQSPDQKPFWTVFLIFVHSMIFLTPGFLTATEIMNVSALKSFPNPVADEIRFYGKDKLQFGELRLPDGAGPHPVMMLIHGGCWLAEYDIAHIRKLADALTKAGIATWTVEYRRVGNRGGGWPGTFDDIASATDYLTNLVEKFNLDLNTFVVAGHSAGGHLAIWLANRPEKWVSAIKPAAVLALAPAADLAFLHNRGVCGNVIDKLMGGSPEKYPQRYQAASGTERLPLSIPQYIVIGRHDKSWASVGERYVIKARQAGNNPHLVIADDSGHFEMIDPDSSTWPLNLETAKQALGIKN